MTTGLLEKEQTVAVKVVMMGKNVTTFVGKNPLSLGELLQEVGTNGNTEVRVNGVAVDKSHPLASGDMVLIVPKIRGG
ncbi:MAG: MoaD/ThiS family protein [Candidatus Methylomirabilales bacterium]|nr:MoaD/ThiS family protein [candidate division NC10 bacterium]